MGGEPTFVSIDDFEAPEWNTAAVGPTKRGAGRRADPPLARAFRARRLAALRPGQMVSGRKPAALGLRPVLAQGRRADLEGSDLIASDREAAQGRRSRTPSASPKASRKARPRRLTTCCRPTRIPRTGCRRKPRCPSMSIRPIPSWPIPKSARGWRGCSSGLNCAKGYVLPIQRWTRSRAAIRRWLSERWKLRRGNCSCARRFPARPAAAARLAAAYVPPEDYPYIVDAGSDRAARARCPTVRQGAAPRACRRQQDKEQSEPPSRCAPR